MGLKLYSFRLFCVKSVNRTVRAIFGVLSALGVLASFVAMWQIWDSDASLSWWRFFHIAAIWTMLNQCLLTFMGIWAPLWGSQPSVEGVNRLNTYDGFPLYAWQTCILQQGLFFVPLTLMMLFAGNSRPAAEHALGAIVGYQVTADCALDSCPSTLDRGVSAPLFCVITNYEICDWQLIRLFHLPPSLYQLLDARATHLYQ